MNKSELYHLIRVRSPTFTFVILESITVSSIQQTMHKMFAALSTK